MSSVEEVSDDLTAMVTESCSADPLEDKIDQVKSQEGSSSKELCTMPDPEASSSAQRKPPQLKPDDIAHRNLERSLGEDFSNRRSPKDSPTRWTDVFSSKRIRRRIHKHFGDSRVEDDRDITDEMVSATQELRSLSSTELTGRVEQVLKDRNIDQKKIDTMLDKMDDERKRLILTQHLKTDVSCTKKAPAMMIDQLLEVLDSDNVLDRKKDIVTLKVILAGEGVRYLSEFARNGNKRSDENGLQLICRLFGVPGLELVLQCESRVVGRLIEGVCAINKRRAKEGEETEVARVLRAEIVKILASLGMVNQESTKNIKMEMS
ncbi:hypothetical protein NECAME_08889, partial [Necator americanus]